MCLLIGKSKPYSRPPDAIERWFLVQTVSSRAPASDASAERITQLEAEVATLKAELHRLYELTGFSKN